MCRREAAFFIPKIKKKGSDKISGKGKKTLWDFSQAQYQHFKRSLSRSARGLRFGA
jgi:hypothetical protein